MLRLTDIPLPLDHDGLDFERPAKEVGCLDDVPVLDRSPDELSAWLAVK